MTQIRPKRRWILGSLMILIAWLAVPLALYIYQVREDQRQQALIREVVKDLEVQLIKESGDRSQIVVQKNVSGSGVSPK